MAVKLSMGDISRASFGESSSSVRVSFKKTVQTAQFESEVYMADLTLDYVNQVSGDVREVIAAIASSQLEFQVLTNLLYKGLVTAKDFTEKSTMLSNQINAFLDKLEKVNPEHYQKLLETMFKNDVGEQ